MFCNKIWRECKFFDYCNWKKIKNNNNYFNYWNKKKNTGYIEELLFELWIKNLYRYEFIQVKDINLFIDKLNIKRNYVIWIHSILEEQSYKNDYLKDWYVYIVVSDEKKSIRDFINFDTSNDYRLRNIWTWKLLWYPDCCIKNAVKQSINLADMKVFEDNEDKIYKDCPMIWNKVRLYVHFPCSSTCLNTINMVEEVLEKLLSLHWEKIIFDFFYKNK